MNTIPSFRTLIEKVQAEDQVYQVKLPVAESKISSVFSKETLDLHYGTLYKNYVEKALAGEGGFQLAGAKLHTLFFEQFQAPKTQNNPHGAADLLITKKFGDYTSFKDAVEKEALDFHGSGWIYLSTSGTIKTIVNHKVVDDVAVIVDLWEHSYIIDYGADKKKYLKAMWKIVNWDIINVRLN